MRIIWPVLFLCFCQSIAAQSIPPAIPTADTLFIDMVDKQKVLVHTVKQGQTLYAIARIYNIPVEDILSYNPAMGTNMQAAQKIYIPIPMGAVVRRRRAGFKWSHHTPVYYHVKAKETMYKLSKVYFNVPLDSLKSRNQLKTDAVQNGQALLIGWFPRTGVPDSVKTFSTNKVGKTLADMRLKFEQDKMTHSETEQEGAAWWNRGDKTTGDESFFAMHDEASLGSIIEVYNPRSKRTLYAKVLGKIPRNEHNENAIVVLSPGLAKALGAIDPKFYVKIKYLK